MVRKNIALVVLVLLPCTSWANTIKGKDISDTKALTLQLLSWSHAVGTPQLGPRISQARLSVLDQSVLERYVTELADAVKQDAALDRLQENGQTF
jgi:predicted small secreted protein